MNQTFTSNARRVLTSAVIVLMACDGSGIQAPGEEAETRLNAVAHSVTEMGAMSNHDGSVTIVGAYAMKPYVTCQWTASISNPHGLPVAVQWFVDDQYAGGGGVFSYQNSGVSFNLGVKATFIDGLQAYSESDSRFIQVDESVPVDCSLF